MARMYPPTYPGDVWAEAQVYQAFSALNDDWHVVSDAFFPVESEHHQTLDGQIDFIVLNRRRGGFVLEVKGGHIRAVDGEWYSRNREGEFPIKDPFKQASDYKYRLSRLIESTTGMKLHLQHAVGFPTMSRTARRVGLHSPDIILFEEDLRDPATALERILGYWKSPSNPLRPEQFQKIIDLLSPTVTLERRLVADVEAAIDEQLHLTREQRSAFAMIKGFKRLWVVGGAGTGKTVLATAHAREVAEDGGRVLLLCFNRNLGGVLRSRLSDAPGVDVGSRDSFAMSVARLPWDDDPAWSRRTLADEFVAACADQGREWDSILIDEGQDFGTYWLEALEQVLAPDGQLIVFADSNQDIFGAGGAVGMPPEPARLTRNCRNTPEIARVADPLVGARSETVGESGIEPEFIETDNLESEVRRALHQVIVDGGVDPTDVAILSSSTDLVESFQGSRVGRWDVTAFGGSGLVCETVGRFKGLEAKAVIVAVPNARGVDPNLLYVALSRARAVLKVIAGPEEMGRIRGLIGQL